MVYLPNLVCINQAIGMNAYLKVMKKMKGQKHSRLYTVPFNKDQAL
ncbi:hypothetical protein SAMN05216323_10985 [Williamwhitmania taraxaci]|uniref:Uncharacterized protein n=1 Tax=Williamwhitmania taraxaci TaxID=1640674 RepID=A0A1G6SNT3_9BACT|nr:hypothetical protein SAMN05216323_10985 [Williamwhitmania taraxaci]